MYLPSSSPRELRNNVCMRQTVAAFFLIFALSAFSASAGAQQAAGDLASTASKATAPHVVPADKLVFFSRPVASFRAPLLGVSARDRVSRAHARIRDQLTLPGSHIVQLKPDALGIQVQIDAATSFVVTPADLDPSRVESLEQAAQNAAAELNLAIRESVESRSLDTLMRALVFALAGTALYGVLVWLVARGRRELARQLVAVTHRHTAKLQVVTGVALLNRDGLAHAVRLLLTLVYRVLVFLMTVEWFSFLLICFPFTRAWGESMNSLLLSLATPVVLATLGAVPGVLTALFIFYIAFLITQVLDRFFLSVQNRTEALAMAFPYLPGSETDAFKGLSVLVGLMLSTGASSLVGQAASGLILTYGRVFRKGEHVRVPDHEGTVTEMGVFTTRIRTGLGEELTISNASILGSTTKNYSRTCTKQALCSIPWSPLVMTPRGARCMPC